MLDATGADRPDDRSLTDLAHETARAFDESETLSLRSRCGESGQALTGGLVGCSASCARLRSADDSRGATACIDICQLTIYYVT